MVTTKYRSVTEQTRSEGFHINWPTGDEGELAKSTIGTC